MTTETRTIDLVALATELEAAGWEVVPNEVSMPPLRDYITALCDEYVINVFTDGRVYLGSEACGYFAAPHAQVFNVNDTLWTALGIVQRHIADTRP